MTKNTGLNQASASERAGSPKFTKITVRYELCTPLFTKRTDGSKPELSTPAVVGAVAFWWRALMWSQLDHKKSDAEKIKQLKDWEAALFGSAKTGQGAARFGPIRWVNEAGERVKPEIQNGKDGGFNWGNEDDQSTFTRKAGVRYLMGQGLPGRGVFKRNAIWSCEKNFYFEFDVSYHSGKLTQENCLNFSPLESLTRAMRILGVLGGVGARSRRGFGGVKIVSIKGVSKEQTESSYFENIFENLNSLTAFLSVLKGLDSQQSIKLPEYSGLSKWTKFTLLEFDQGNKINNVMDKVGHAFHLYRGWGDGSSGSHLVAQEASLHSQDLLREPDKKHYRYKADHDWFKRSWNRKNTENQQSTLISRTQFGLPLGFRSNDDPHGVSETGKKLRYSYSARIAPNTRQITRRASPLFFKFLVLSDQKVVCLLIEIPAQFLPVEATISSVRSIRKLEEHQFRKKFRAVKDYASNSTCNSKVALSEFSTETPSEVTHFTNWLTEHRFPEQVREVK